MGIYRLCIDGWFSKKKKEVDLPPLSEDQLRRLKKGESVYHENDAHSFLIYLESGCDLKDLKENDLIIRQLPYASSKTKPLPTVSEEDSMHIINFFDILLNFFVKKEDMAQWLITPSNIFDDKTPLQYLKENPKGAYDRLSRLANP